MNKSWLLSIACTLTLSAVISSAKAAIVASTDAAITGADQSCAQMFTGYPSLFADGARTLNVPGEPGQTQAAGNFNCVIDGTPAASPQTNSHMDLLLLLIVAAVAGILSEIYDRRSYQ